MQDPRPEIQLYGQYDPLKWPPDLPLARVHMKCSCPGRDIEEGIECPCCGRLEKLKIRNWYSRSITRDFKSYGGGIPCYFQLIKYCTATLIVLAAMINFYHIYVIEKVCRFLAANNPGQQCAQVFVIFKFCTPTLAYQTLLALGNETEAYAFFYLQLVSFIYLIAATLGMKIWLQRVNQTKIVKEEKLYSEYSLLLKNIPKFYSIQDLQKQILALVPGADICELFFVYGIGDLDTIYRRMFDLSYQIEFAKESIQQKRGQTQTNLAKLQAQYIQLYQKYQNQSKKIGKNNGRAIVVFNSIHSRDELKNLLTPPTTQHLTYHLLQLLGQSTNSMHLLSYKLPEPQQIHWKYIGEHSATKTRTKIHSSLVGLGFMLLAFGLLFVPIIQIEQMKGSERSTMTTVLGLLTSLVLQLLTIAHRQIVIRLIPFRKPSSRESESKFIVITTVIFHFLFYLLAPVSYYLISTDSVPANIKLKQLFMAVLVFLIMNLVFAGVDVRYRIYNARRRKILSGWTHWAKYCQLRLHQQLRWPTFPIELKLMVIYNLWSFNAFYIFQIPYLLVLFVVALIGLYWIDKRNIYQHYKMQSYLSIQLEISSQKDYLWMFLVCVCGGYALSAMFYWQYIVAGVAFVVSGVLNLGIGYRTRQQKQAIHKNKSTNLDQLAKQNISNVKQSMVESMIEKQMRENLLLVGEQMSAVSVGSVNLHFGYQEVYQVYLGQFRNRAVGDRLARVYGEALGGTSVEMQGREEKGEKEVEQEDSVRSVMQEREERIGQESQQAASLPAQLNEVDTQLQR